MEQRYDMIVTGGGLTGCCLALATARAGMRVALVDSQPGGSRAAPEFDGRSYALALASQRMLVALGVWPALAAEAQPILDVVASDGRAGEGASPWILHLDHAEIEEGPMGYMIEDRHLRPALLAALAGEPLITHLVGEAVVAQSVEGAGVSVTLASGRVLNAALLVGADGRRSGTATRAGIGRMQWGYGQTALVCAVAHELPHKGIAHQFFMPGGPLAILPLTGNRSSIVWSEASDAAQGYAALDDAAFLEALRPRFGSFLGQIALAGRRHEYPLDLSLAHRFVAERLVLVGDAAQGVHPIAGQGLNQGLRDVATLAQVLAEARRRGEDIGSPPVLERHRRWRSFDRAGLAFATDAFNRLFSNDNPILRVGRDLGMGLVTALPGLRRRVMREAAGLSGDVPRLLTGKPA